MLTIKSDDVAGRAKAFEAIIKGVDIPTPKVPESFKVLIRELQSLGMNIQPTHAVIADEEEEETPEVVEEVKKEAEELQEALEAGNVETPETGKSFLTGDLVGAREAEGSSGPTAETELIVDSVKQTEMTEEDKEGGSA
jgi:DNA-directed RNA polymerase subunit beta